MTQSKIFLFVQTPRGGLWNHCFIVPTTGAVAGEAMMSMYCNSALNTKTDDNGLLFGEDFIALRRTVQQVAFSRKGTELLVLATPDYDLSAITDDARKKIAQRLRSFSQELEELITNTIAWGQVGGGKTLVHRAELNNWCFALEPLLSNLKPRKKKQMNSFTKIIIPGITILALGASCAYCGSPDISSIGESIFDGLSTTGSDVNKSDPSLIHYGLWRESLNLGTTKDKAEIRRLLIEKFERVLTVEKAKNPFTASDDEENENKKDADSQKLVRLLTSFNTCLQKPISDLRDAPLEKFIENQNLREKTKLLFPVTTKKEHNVLFGINDLGRNPRESIDISLTKFFPQSLSHEQKLKKLKELRSLIAAAIAVKENADKCEKNKPDWVKHAAALSFEDKSKDQKEHWKTVEKLSPKFITAADVQMCEQIRKWLMCEGREKSDNFLGTNTDRDFSNLLKKVGKIESEESIFRPEKYENYESVKDGRTSEKKALYESIQKFREAAAQFLSKDATVQRKGDSSSRQ
jgi:hypothetical protein